MADISLIQDVCMDDCDEGVFEQGDCSSASPADDDVLPPLSRVQKYAQSGNVYDRQMVARIVQELFRTAPAETLAEEMPNIMKIIRNLGEKDEAMVRADLLEQIPHMAAQALQYSSRVEALKNVIGEYLLPLVVRNLGCSDNAVDKAAHLTLIHMMEQGLITRPQAEIQVCPAILALSSEDQTADINTGAIALMSRMAPLLGRDVTERIFLKRFFELCSSSMFYIRKAGASHIGDFCAVIGKDQFEKVLLPCYIVLCQDDIWGVRKACAEVIMFVSSVCPPETRKSVLAPTFAKLLQDGCRWVQMSAFQTLGPFISTFANPPITNIAYSNQGELVFVNKDGNEFMINSPSVPDIRFCKFMPKHPSLFDSIESCSQKEIALFLGIKEEDLKDQKDPSETSTSESNNGQSDGNEDFYTVDTQTNSQSDDDIKEIVETVKNAVLSYRNVEQEYSVIRDNLNLSNFRDNLKPNLSNSYVITDSEKETCDHLGSIINKLIGTSKIKEILEPSSDPDSNVTNSDVVVSNSSKSDLDANNEDKSENITTKQAHLEDLFSNISLSDIVPESPAKPSANSEMDNAMKRITMPDQDIVPEVLIKHFILMTDSSFSINIDNEMSYHCAYSLPAVALTLENKNWPLLKHTIERLASDMQYKVRRTVASSLHELALILGREIATEHLTPIFEGFIKDLDEVRIGILKHLAYFLRLIKPEKRVMYLPRLQEFLQTENEWNWRFRHELAKQLLMIVTLFKPIDAAKHIGLVAENLLHDVSAVRQVAISLITELLRHISNKPGLNSLYLVRLVEKFAHSKIWKRRQTFALLCFKLLSCQALPAEQFACEIMPHLLDLSWDPVANVRLVVAKTISQHIITNEYFSNPDNQHFDSLGTVVRRLQADKDRDVRQYAEISSNRPPSPPAALVDCID